MLSNLSQWNVITKATDCCKSAMSRLYIKTIYWLYRTYSLWCFLHPISRHVMKHRRAKTDMNDAIANMTTGMSPFW